MNTTCSPHPTFSLLISSSSSFFSRLSSRMSSGSLFAVCVLFFLLWDTNIVCGLDHPFQSTVNGMASHQIGQREHSSREEELKLKETFYKKEKHILKPGERLSLKCIATGSPLPTITWSLDGSPIPETHRIQYGDYVSMNGDVVSYVNISGVEQEDGGVYKCEARNEFGAVVHSEQVFISGPPFIKPLGNITVQAGNSLTIRCPVTGYPIQRIKWSKGGRELPSTERQKVFENGTLIVLDASRELDEGIYVCKANNDQGEQFSRNLHIQVLKKPSISPFRFPSSLTEGMSIITTCSILTGDPPIHVDWFKDGLPLDTSTLNVHRNEMGDLGSSLVFRSVGQSHAGNYTCTARNRVGEVSYTAPMIVKMPPKWKIEPSDQSAVVGDRVTFDCSAQGYPPPLIRWKISQGSGQKNDFKSISSNYHIQTLENGSLTIKEIEEKDSGSYLCEAGNGVGADLSAVVHLSVHVKAHFKNNFQVLKVPKGKPIVISCEAFGEKPLNIKWAKDRSPIDPSTDRKFMISTRETDSGLVSELTSSSSGRGDSGTFTCTTWNSFGQSELSSRLLIEEVPDPPFGLKVSEVASKSVSLRWSPPFTGNLPLTKYIVQWKKEKESGDWSTNSFTSEIGATSSQIFIPDLKPLTLYQFRVLAVNSAGQSEPSHSLAIKTEEEAPGTAPLSVRVEPLSSKSVRVKWKPPKHIESFGSITGYYIGYKVLGSEKSLTFKTVEMNHGHNSKLEAIVSNLKKSTMYTFSVQAYNTKGAGPSSPEVTGKTLDKDPPSPPRLRVISSAANSVTLGWTQTESSSSFESANSVTGYRVFLRSNSEEWKSHETLAETPKVNTHTIRGLKCGTKYQVYMLAFNEVGNSDPSESLAFQTEGGAPVAPDKSSLMTINSSYVMLRLSSWKSSSCAINNFIIQYKLQGSNEWTLISATVSPLLDTYLIPDLYSGTWYNLLIGAHSDAGSTEAEYLFATLTENGATVAPLSVSVSLAGAEEANTRLRRYVQMFLPVISIFVAFVVILVLLLLLSFKKNQRNVPSRSNGDGGCDSKMDGRSMSMSSVGKVVYESVRRGDRQDEMSCNVSNRGNVLYCPSPYATTRVSLYFPPEINDSQSRRDSDINNEANCYDMPLLKQSCVKSLAMESRNNVCASSFQPQPLIISDPNNLMDINQRERSFCVQ